MYSVLQLITAHLQCEAAKTNFFSGLWQIPHFNGVHGPILPLFFVLVCGRSHQVVIGAMSLIVL